LNLLATPKARLALFSLLYLSEGAPIGFIWWALPTYLRSEGIELVRITSITATLVLPWTFKFLWAPLVDSLRTARWGYRHTIIAAQLAMGLVLLPLVWLEPVQYLNWWWLLLLAHAFMAATQDVAVDALAISSTPEAARGTLTGAMQAGMLTGRSIFGGGAIVAATSLGRTWVIIGLVACIWFSTLLLLLAREPQYLTSLRTNFSGFSSHLKVVVRRRTTWLGLAFALTGAAAFEATGQMAGPYLLDRGVAEESVGVFFGVIVVAAMLVGGLAGGRLADRWGRVRSTAIFLIGFTTAVVALAIYDVASQNAAPQVLFTLLGAMYFMIGMFIASSYALFMKLSDARLGGTQFSAFMSATNGCESWSVFAGGRIAAAGGYPMGFIALSAVSLLSLPLLKLISLATRSSTAKE
jgi:MFS family permease